MNFTRFYDENKQYGKIFPSKNPSIQIEVMIFRNFDLYYNLWRSLLVSFVIWDHAIIIFHWHPEGIIIVSGWSTFLDVSTAKTWQANNKSN